MEILPKGLRGGQVNKMRVTVFKEPGSRKSEFSCFSQAQTPLKTYFIVDNNLSLLVAFVGLEKGNILKTYVAKKETVEHNWFLVDAKGKVLGRVASKVASVLRGKHKPIFTPHVDTGDHVIVINAGQVKLTGKKLGSKVYYHHTGYPGGLKDPCPKAPRGKTGPDGNTGHQRDASEK